MAQTCTHPMFSKDEFHEIFPFFAGFSLLDGKKFPYLIFSGECISTEYQIWYWYRIIEYHNTALHVGQRCGFHQGRFLTGAERQNSLGFSLHTPQVWIPSTQFPPALPRIEKIKVPVSTRLFQRGWSCCLFGHALISLPGPHPPGQLWHHRWPLCFLRILTPVRTT